MRTFNITISLLIGICTSFFFSCADDISVNSSINKQIYEGTNNAYGFISTVNSVTSPIELYNDKLSDVVELQFKITNPVESVTEVELVYDTNIKEEYNETHGTQFELFPADGISLEEEGKLLIAPGDVDTYTINMTIHKPDNIVDGTYILPIKVNKISGNIELAKGEDTLILLVKIYGDRPSTDKPGDFVTICYVEVNGNNPLNAGEWTLASSGKQLIDIVNLFAANINYDEDKKCPYVYLNKNLQYILNHRDKYIRPLQEKGIKVCLTILGNGQGVGVANLSDEDARNFAQELKAIVEAYGLDGIDFDDEWSKYEDFDRPGFPDRGPYPYERLCYETKMAMPDKLCTVYYIGAIVPYPELGFNGFDMLIDGMKPGDFIDYAYEAQYGALSSEKYKKILGMESRQWGGFSIDLIDPINTQVMNFDVIKADGNGVQVVYDLRSTDYDYLTKARYENTFGYIAKKLYDDPLGAKHSGINYYKEW